MPVQDVRAGTLASVYFTTPQPIISPRKKKEEKNSKKKKKKSASHKRLAS
jgi:hypothetical protein